VSHPTPLPSSRFPSARESSAERQAPPQSNEADVQPSLISTPEEVDDGAEAVEPLAEPSGAAAYGTDEESPPALPPHSKSKNVETLEALLQESKAALQQRDKALTKLVSIEEELTTAQHQLEALIPLKQRAGELQEQLGTVIAERDQNASALAEAQQQVETLTPYPAQVEALTRKLEAVDQARHKLVQEFAKARGRIAQLEKEVKDYAERLKNSETAFRKAETALANAKESRDEYEYRLHAIKAIGAGEAPPPRSKR
jgi:chromosome segregation ATPase